MQEGPGGAGQGVTIRSDRSESASTPAGSMHCRKSEVELLREFSQTFAKELWPGTRLPQLFERGVLVLVQCPSR